MSTESDYKKLLVLKNKFENLEAARRNVSNAQQAILNREAKVSQINVKMPSKPSMPKKNTSKSSAYLSEHRGSLAKAYKKKMWAVIILFSIGFVILAVVGYEFALQNYANVHTSFGKWVLDKLGEPNTSMRVFTYIGAALLAIGNLILYAIELLTTIFK